jgi:hypothetical protein
MKKNPALLDIYHAYIRLDGDYIGRMFEITFVFSIVSG